jgi:hypothetical protein
MKTQSKDYEDDKYYILQENGTHFFFVMKGSLIVAPKRVIMISGPFTKKSDAMNELVDWMQGFH